MIDSCRTGGRKVYNVRCFPQRDHKNMLDWGFAVVEIEIDERSVLSVLCVVSCGECFLLWCRVNVVVGLLVSQIAARLDEQNWNGIRCYARLREENSIV